MKALTLIGIVLILLGGLALAYQGFTYVSRETVAQVGPVQVLADRERTVWLPPVVGGLAIVGGIALLIVGARSERSLS